MKIAKSDKKGGRPKGRKDSKPRKPKRTPPPKKQTIPAQLPQPKPQSDNPQFEAKLEGLAPQVPDRTAQEVTPETIIGAEDVTEFVKWPFGAWSELNKMPDLKISDNEAKSVAEPLTRILNRHNIGGVIHPDWLDGLTAAARLSPIMIKRFELVKAEREKRKTEQGGSDQPAGNADQGGSRPAQYDPTKQK